MSIPSSPSHTQVTSTPALGAAVLVLDAHGRVELANAAAAALWQARATELAGDFLPNLFVFEVTSRDPDLVQAQWEVVQAAALAQPVTLRLQPKEAAAFDAIVRLEQASADPVRYFATITRSAPAPAAFAISPTASAANSGSVASGAHATSAAPAGDNFLALLAERSALGFFDLNFVKNETYLSPVWKRMLGYTDTSLPNTYESWLALIHPDDSAAAPDKLAGRAAPGGSRPFSVEYRMKHARGHFVWVQAVGAQLFAPNGALQRVVGAQIDVTDRKELEEASLRAEERLNALAERGRLALFELDFTDGGASWLSPAFKATLGFNEAELPDEPESFLRALPPEDSAGGLAAFFTSKQPGQPVYFDALRLRHRNGTDLWAYAGIVRIISRKRELQRVLGFVAPMPEGVGNSAGSGVSAEHFSALLAEIHEAVLLVDAHDKVVFANHAAERLLGQPVEQLVGQAGSEVFRLKHRTSGAPGESPIEKALTTGEATGLNNEFSLERGAGATAAVVPIVFSCRAVSDAGGQSAGAVVVFRDPDEMSLTPEELVKANRFEALGQLAGGIAHDYNNVLTTIMGGVSLALDARDYSGLENSMKACEAAKGLSRQLLMFSKGGTGTRQVIKTADLLRDSVRIAASGSTVKVELNAPADLATIQVDRAQMLQVFQNLIVNAIQAMPSSQGNVWITAGNVTLAPAEIQGLVGGQYVAIEVRDNGSGIKPEHLEKIFDPFFTTKKTGTGLGLATVLSIVKRHGGQIGLDTELGVGTTFTVFLPRAEQETVVETRRPIALNFALTGRVLFMDDDVEISRLTEGMLAGIGYKVDLAKDGEEAIKFYKRYLNINRPYDVVIMDLTVIGGMGGEECFRKLRELDPNVRAIVASGYDNDEMKRQFLELGFCGYLTKPYRVGDLSRAIKGVLGT
ncbi:MAG: PAS domain-containing protein [Opitutae bacterium]|nr:PAS domain-containing protein [Opitutae bacterium]